MALFYPPDVSRDSVTQTRQSILLYVRNKGITGTLFGKTLGRTRTSRQDFIVFANRNLLGMCGLFI